MTIDVKKFIRLSVFTESGIKLGKIFNIIIDVNTQAVMQYEVRQMFWGGRVYVIKPSQVVVITLEKMVVTDALLKDLQKEVASGPIATASFVRE